MRHKPFQKTARRCLHRRGSTFIDVALGSMILTVLLIPSIHLMGESRSVQRRLAVRDAILFEAENLMAATKISLSETRSFDTAYASRIDSQQTIAVTDGPDLISRIRVEADPSVSKEKLLRIVVDVWNDVDRDLVMDAEEIGETLRSQWAEP